MDVLSNIVPICERVNRLSKHVKINYDKLDEIITELDFSKGECWLESNPFNIMQMGASKLINFLLMYHTIGDYCFWGEPKWEIDTENGKLDGSFAILYLLVKDYTSFCKQNLTFEEFSNLLKANVEIPLLKDRYENLVIMNQFLETKHSDFYTLIKDMTDDQKLFAFIIENLPYFKDESEYEGENIYFYKRAQLLVSDILHARKELENIAVHYDHLVGCADYKIPQVMRCYGILEFDKELSQIVDKKIEIPSNSPLEVEIRANDIMVIDYIARKLEYRVPKMDINDYLWSLGQDKSKMTKPYHRTLTSKY